MYTLIDICFCARVCERQGTTPLAVPGMLTALSHAKAWDTSHRPLDEGIILTMAVVIDEINHKGYRTVPIISGSHKIGADCRLIPGLMAHLVTDVEKWTPEEFCFEFERIYPFLDGNGRVSALLYNMLKGTLYLLQDAPTEVQKKSKA
jgi:hypothetical protein